MLPGRRAQVVSLALLEPGPCESTSGLMERLARLEFALVALARFGSAAKFRAALRQSTEPQPPPISSEDAERIRDEAAALADRGIDVCVLGDSRYPPTLAALRQAPPALFMWGNPELLTANAVGMCGSRHASDKGLQAATVCGEEVAGRRLAVISGYAKGVDTQTHLAALGCGGRTIIVLAEGILYFRKKKVFDDVGLDFDRVLVLSQFPPSQRWNVGAAMTRNGVIAGLGKALVVIEAGETGGTLNAGLQAMEMGRPVLALEFSVGTPVGNQALFEKGAIPIRSRAHLGRVLDQIGAAPNRLPLRVEQLNLM